MGHQSITEHYACAHARTHAHAHTPTEGKCSLANPLVFRGCKETREPKENPHEHILKTNSGLTITDCDVPIPLAAPSCCQLVIYNKVKKKTSIIVQ